MRLNWHSGASPNLLFSRYELIFVMLDGTFSANMDKDGANGCLLNNPDMCLELNDGLDMPLNNLEVRYYYYG